MGLVLLLALGVGPVVRLLGAAPLVAARRYELDFYVFHQPCIKLAAFVLTCVLAWLQRAARGLLTRTRAR